MWYTDIVFCYNTRTYIVELIVPVIKTNNITNRQ